MLAARFHKILFLFIFSLIPFFANANVVINEIMYDLEGADSGREWIEIFNNGTEQIDLNGWKLYEAEVNHKIATTTTNNFIIPSGGFAVIADNPEKFLMDWPNFPGVIFDSAFSLNNSGENLVIKDGSLNIIDEVNYLPDWGAKGDGDSLQKINSSWIAAKPTPEAQNTDKQSLSQNNSESDSESETEQQAQQTTNVIDWPVEPQIFANAGSDKTAVVGADVYFSGKALGIKKEPLENARYLWNFGDGAISEGQNVKHVYKYPGEYIVILDVSSGKYSASGRLTAKIIPNQLEIIEANQNYIKLHNGSSVELDISHWFLRAGNISFKFPANTFIKANKDLMIDFLVSGIKAENQETEILYPNGSIAFSYPSTIVKSSAFNNPMLVQKPIIPKQKTEESFVVASIESVESSASSTDSQVANAISVVKGNGVDIKNWLLAIFGIGAISGVGLILVRRQGLL